MTVLKNKEKNPIENVSNIDMKKREREKPKKIIHSKYIKINDDITKKQNVMINYAHTRK